MCRAERISSRLSPIVDVQSSRPHRPGEYLGKSFVRAVSIGRSTFIRLSCCPIICTPSGRSLGEMLSIRSDGLGLSVSSRSAGRRLEDRRLRSPRVERETVDVACGKRSFLEHTIEDEADMERHVDSIHYNPVRHGYVKCPIDWPWSSLHKWVRYSAYPRK